MNAIPSRTWTLGWSVMLLWLSMSFVAPLEAAGPAPLRCIMYLTGQHPVTPPVDQLAHVSHVALAFMTSGTFNDPDRSEWPLFLTVEETRTKFAPGTKILVAIGGWGDTIGFSAAALTLETRTMFAQNVARMVAATGADGIDVDWEYPGGNGEDYKQVPNSSKAWEIDAYPLLLGELRAALGPGKVISAAVPGLVRDMIAFTHETVPRIMRHLDFLNVMTYDMMNRRDTITKHHTGVQLSLEAVDAYISNGAAPQKVNLGFAFYTKYFETEHDACLKAPSPVGCPTLLLENSTTGADMGRAGGFSWHDQVPLEVADSFTRALHEGEYDEKEGGFYYWDADTNLWWTFDTADAIKRKFPLVVQKRRLGGVFAWGLGEDAPLYEHLGALNEGMGGVFGRWQGRALMQELQETLLPHGLEAKENRDHSEIAGLPTGRKKDDDDIRHDIIPRTQSLRDLTLVNGLSIESIIRRHRNTEG